jgi:glycosyltransferase involved in cell wall biosynthesis
MPSVDILIPNHNADIALALCVESIRVHTRFKNYRIVVHDESTAVYDREYLTQAERLGWLTYVRGVTRGVWESAAHHAPYWHGCALNVLIHDYCRADFAVILDSDVYILDDNWLRTLHSLMARDVLVAAHEWLPTCRKRGIYVPGWWRPHFMMLNMAAYRDGMAVDWRGGSARLNVEPYRTVFADLRADDTDGTVIFDPGSSLWVKMALDNPHGYRGVPLPNHIEERLYHHFQQKSLRALEPKEYRQAAAELDRLRAGRH